MLCGGESPLCTDHFSLQPSYQPPRIRHGLRLHIRTKWRSQQMPFSTSKTSVTYILSSAASIEHSDLVEFQEEAKPIMCIQVVERYSVCGCVYFRHSIDPCPNRSQRGHFVQEKVVHVGYTCPNHSRARSQLFPRCSWHWTDPGFSSDSLEFPRYCLR